MVTHTQTHTQSTVPSAHAGEGNKYQNSQLSEHFGSQAVWIIEVGLYMHIYLYIKQSSRLMCSLPNVQQWSIGFGSGGASMMTVKSNGVAALLQKNPYIHCTDVFPIAWHWHRLQWKLTQQTSKKLLVLISALVEYLHLLDQSKMLGMNC